MWGCQTVQQSGSVMCFQQFLENIKCLWHSGRISFRLWIHRPYLLMTFREKYRSSSICLCAYTEYPVCLFYPPSLSLHLCLCLSWHPAVRMCHCSTNAIDLFFFLSHTNNSLFVPVLFQRPLFFKSIRVVQGQGTRQPSLGPGYNPR